MILGFSTQLNGKETYFVEKILKGIQSYYLGNDILINMDLYWHNTIDDNVLKAYLKPKIHTIREDKNNRWQIGDKIDFFINCRQPNMQRFAPVITVESVQNIEIIYVPFGDKKQDARPFVRVDGRLIYDVGQTLWSQMKEFAENDGFESVNDFFEYFNKDFTGKIIHWTNIKY